MSLEYSFRETFRHKVLRPKRLWAVLSDLDSRVGSVENTLSNAVDSDTIYDDTALDSRVSHLEGLVTTDISFSVKDSTPEAIEGAVVSIASLNKSSTTGNAGGCSLTGIIHGTYTVTVTADGYEDYSDEITVDATHTSFDIELTTTT